MKSISKILRQTLKKNAQELIKRDKEFIFEGSWCDKNQKQLEEGINLNPQPSIITEQGSTCNPYQSRIPNDWSSPGPIDACASQGEAAKCSQIDPNYTGTLANLCSTGLISGQCINNFAHIKLFPPTGPPMTSQNACEGGWTPVAGDYMLSHAGGGGGPQQWVPWLIVEAFNFGGCAGPRLGHYVCDYVPAGCMDNNATNYSPAYSSNCTQDPTYPANCIGGATGGNCCCTYPQLGPGCTDPLATNYNAYSSPDDGSCEYEGCTDPNAPNYSFNFTPFPGPPAITPQVTGNNQPYDPTGNGGTAIDNGSCQAPTTGCLDCPNCPNYDPTVQTDDGSCLGCTDPTSLNYEPNADIDDGTCVYLSFDCVQNLCEENINGTGIHASLPDCLASQDCDRWECVEEWVPTPIDPADIPKDKAIAESATNMLKEQGQIGINPVLTVDDLANALCVEPPGGCPPLQAPWGIIQTMWQGAPVCKCLSPSVQPPAGSIVNGCYRCDDGKYDPLTKTWDPKCEFLQKCIPKGCTDPNALNYDPNAQVDDGSCEYPSCDNLPLLLANPGTGVLGGNEAYIQDAYDMGQTNGQINGVLDGNSVFCLEICGGFTGTLSTQFPCDCCGVKDCEEMGTHPNAVPVDCVTCGIPNPALQGTCHNITNWQPVSSYPPNTNFYNTMADCIANVSNDENCKEIPLPTPSCKNDPNFCQTNPYLTPGGECWICHMYTECMPMYDYLQYGSQLVLQHL